MVMRERFRDKTRDNLEAALQSLGLPASMSERDVPIENVQKPGWARALGSIEVEEGPISRVNLFKIDGSQYSATRWWYVFLVPDDRPFAQDRAVSIKSIRKKSFPIFGKAVEVTWSGEDYDTGLLAALPNDLQVNRLVMKRADLEIKRHTKDDFDGWAIGIEKRFAPSQEEWRVLCSIAERLLDSHAS